MFQLKRLNVMLMLCVFAVPRTAAAGEWGPIVDGIFRITGRVIERGVAEKAGELGEQLFQRVKLNGNAGRLFGEETVHALADGLRELASDADPHHQTAIEKIIGSVDQNVSIEEFEMLVRRVDHHIREYDYQIKEFEYQLSTLRQDVEANREYIAAVEQMLKRHKDEVQKTFERIDESIVELKAGLAALRADVETEVRERKLEDAVQWREISRLSRLISPDTAKQTSAILGAKGAKIIIDNGDPKEAATLLQLAMAYDKRENRFADPGLRYYLAVSYRRMGDENRANELLLEGIVAQRFRELPDWYVRRTEFFQGNDRKWLRDAQFDPRFGVRSPRNPEIAAENRIPIQVPLPQGVAALPIR